MIKFDKLKIVTSIDYINIINNKSFTANIRDNHLLYYKYQQETPYNLMIMKNYQHNELILEFTGKILLDKYSSLINLNTIRECLQEINRLGICYLDIDSILSYGEVTKCDVTKDITYHKIEDIINIIKQNISNYEKWITKAYLKEGLVVENVVKTPRYKKRLSIYDKGKEMLSSNNKYFLNMLKNKEQLLAWFKGKIRFELNIGTKEGIRQLLNVPNNNLQTVLASKTNPILTVFDEAISDSSGQQRKPMELKDYEHILLLKECGYNMKAVSAKIKTLISPSTSLNRTLKVYRNLYSQIQNDPVTGLDIRDMIARE